MICGNCSKKITEDAMFCSLCGTSNNDSISLNNVPDKKVQENEIIIEKPLCNKVKNE